MPGPDDKLFRAIDGGGMPRLSESASELFDQQVERNEARAQEHLQASFAAARSELERHQAYDRAIYKMRSRTVGTNIKLAQSAGYGFALGFIAMAVGCWLFRGRQ